MKYKDLIILLPCHSLEDFPTHHEGEEAAGLLAGWSALWHPALIASAGSMPSWFRVDSPPDELAERLLIVPGVSEAELPIGFTQRAKDSGACLIRNKTDRQEILETALSRLDPADTKVDPELAADFLALGYCYLQIELLTRQMRYSSNLDEIHFQNQLIDAAKAAMQGDVEMARDRLTSCFDVLAEERDHYYPVDACIMDLTMLASTTLGASLRKQLDSELPTNLLMTAQLLDEMSQREPETLTSLRLAVEEKRVGLIGGEYDERRLPLVSCETIRSQLLCGLEKFEAYLGDRPRVFGRRRFGLTPVLPQILHKLGFEAALHATLEDGSFPEGTQSKVRWEGCDTTALDSIGRSPFDANQAGTYLNYAIKMGESMDMDNVATIVLAHWPGQISTWYEDLRRISRYGSALGKFVTIEDFFRDTDLPVHQDRFQADQYRSPYLKQAVIRKHPDPISSSVRYWQQRGEIEVAQSLSALTQLVSPHIYDKFQQLQQSIEQRMNELDAVADEGPGEDSADPGQALCQQAVEHFAACLPRQEKEPEPGYLIVNPHSFVRRVGVELPELDNLPAVERPVYAVSKSGNDKFAVVDVPPMGFAWVSAATRSAKSSPATELLADECLLRNEFFEVLIDPATGGLRAVREYNSRTNRMSQQLSLRFGAAPRRKANEVWQEQDLSALYSVMAADSIETTLATSTVGEIVARGRMLNRKGETLAGFTQTYRLWRGCRVLELDIELDPQTECKSDPWNSYYAARFAWGNETAELRRDVNLTRQPTSAKRLEAPHYVDIEEGKKRTTILTGGLPFHRKPGGRMLDTILITRGESARKFRLGIGLDAKNPLQQAIGLQTPVRMLYQTAPPPSPSGSSWLFHLNARTITATHWEPIVEAEQASGFRVRLLETAGRSAKVALSTFRPVSSARQLNLDGSPHADCDVSEGTIQLEMSAHQWTEIEAHW